MDDLSRCLSPGERLRRDQHDWRLRRKPRNAARDPYRDMVDYTT